MMATRNTNLESAAAIGEGPHSHRLNYKQWWLLSVVALCGLIFSFALFWTLRHEERQMAGVQFRLEAAKKVEAIKQSLANQLGVMNLFRAFYAGSLEVDRNEFNIFSDSVFEEHPEIQTLAWMPRIRSEERRSFEEAVKKSGFPQFQITQRSGGVLVPAGEHKEYFPILFIESRVEHQDILGFDLGSLPECHAAMDRAEGKRPPAISYANIPGFDSKSKCAIYMFDDAHNEPPAGDSAKSAFPTDGFILGVFQLPEVINIALELIPPTGVDIYLFDATDPKRVQSIFSCASRIRTTPLPKLESPPAESSAPIHYDVRITAADRTWLVYCLPTDVYFSGKSGWEAGGVVDGFADYRTYGGLFVVAYRADLAGGKTRYRAEQ